jgi:prepilin-type N-terminal cleavage/methylation domain-containing protein
MKETGHHRLDNGFSLVEILVCIVILAVGIIGIVGVLPQGIGQVTDAGRISTINHLGQQKMDQLRGTFFSAKDLAAGNHPSIGLGDVDDVETNDQWPEIPKGYSRTWRVTENPAGVKTVVVEVGFNIFDDTGTSLNSTKRIVQKRTKFSTIVTQ